MECKLFEVAELVQLLFRELVIVPHLQQEMVLGPELAGGQFPGAGWTMLCLTAAIYSSRH